MAQKPFDVVIVGGGNSAGQAAVHMAAHAAKVTTLLRRDTLGESMSDYLIKEIENTPKIAVRPATKVAEVQGEGWLEVFANRVRVLVAEAHSEDDLDVSDLKRRLDEAEQSLKEAEDGHGIVQHLSKLIGRMLQ